MGGGAGYVKWSTLSESNGMEDFTKFDILLGIMIISLAIGFVAFMGSAGALRENISCLKLVFVVDV